MAIVILATGTTAGLTTYVAYSRAHLADNQTTVADELASRLMAEILTKKYEDPESSAGSFGLESGEVSRSDYDDVDDYENLSQSPPIGPDGATMNDYTGYTQFVIVSNVDDNTLKDVKTQGTTESKRVWIVITYGEKVRSELIGYRIKQNGFY